LVREKIYIYKLGSAQTFGGLRVQTPTQEYKSITIYKILKTYKTQTNSWQTTPPTWNP